MIFNWRNPERSGTTSDSTAVYINWRNSQPGRSGTTSGTAMSVCGILPVSYYLKNASYVTITWSARGPDPGSGSWILHS